MSGCERDGWPEGPPHPPLPPAQGPKERRRTRQAPSRSPDHRGRRTARLQATDSQEVTRAGHIRLSRGLSPTRLLQNAELWRPPQVPRALGAQGGLVRCTSPDPDREAEGLPPARPPKLPCGGESRGHPPRRRPVAPAAASEPRATAGICDGVADSLHIHQQRPIPLAPLNPEIQGPAAPADRAGIAPTDVKFRPQPSRRPEGLLDETHRLPL